MNDLVIIVEGKNDRAQLKKVLPEDTLILLTNGVPNQKKLQELKKQARDRDVYILTDNDSTGKKIRKLVHDTFPGAMDLYTKERYNGVEATPTDVLRHLLEKAGLFEAKTSLNS
ncbi:toprim domain-containing protein [Brevibacillus dissolubilis]|uniref:toprim domain-containing protein n=1 Tax=Brevibacillus dissolubilis TaxID=1844116 RepID=UPI001116C127|nr:toprim domain-containing protein [Brevibacillus dissolubilis]